MTSLGTCCKAHGHTEAGPRPHACPGARHTSRVLSRAPCPWRPLAAAGRGGGCPTRTMPVSSHLQRKHVQGGCGDEGSLHALPHWRADWKRGFTDGDVPIPSDTGHCYTLRAQARAQGKPQPPAASTVTCEWGRGASSHSACISVMQGAVSTAPPPPHQPCTHPCFRAGGGAREACAHAAPAIRDAMPSSWNACRQMVCRGCPPHHEEGQGHFGRQWPRSRP